MAVSVLNYLRINRVDQADKQVRAMSGVDDDATITQLATAWVDVFLVRALLLGALLYPAAAAAGRQMDPAILHCSHCRFVVASWLAWPI